MYSGVCEQPDYSPLLVHSGHLCWWVPGQASGLLYWYNSIWILRISIGFDSLLFTRRRRDLSSFEFFAVHFAVPLQTVLLLSKWRWFQCTRWVYQKSVPKESAALLTHNRHSCEHEDGQCPMLCRCKKFLPGMHTIRSAAQILRLVKCRRWLDGIESIAFDSRLLW